MLIILQFWSYYVAKPTLPLLAIVQGTLPMQGVLHQKDLQLQTLSTPPCRGVGRVRPPPPGVEDSPSYLYVMYLSLKLLLPLLWWQIL